LQNLCFFAGVLTPPPAPLAPAHAGFCTGKWYACVVVVRLMCRKVSPSAAFSGDRRDEICSTSATLGKKFPRPLAAACNARRNSYGVTAILEREICHCSNISFEQWIFLPCKLYKQICFKLKKGCCKTSSFATAPAKKQTTWHSALQ